MRQSNIFAFDALHQDEAGAKKTSIGLPMDIYHDFVDRYVIQNVRAPKTPLPVNIIENDM